MTEVIPASQHGPPLPCIIFDYLSYKDWCTVKTGRGKSLVCRQQFYYELRPDGHPDHLSTFLKNQRFHAVSVFWYLLFLFRLLLLK